MGILIILLVILYLTSGKLGTINTTLACATWLLMGLDMVGLMLLEQ